MEGLKERINEIKDYYRLSNRGFAAALGTKPAATNNYLNGTKEPSLDFVDAILSKYVDISAEWLLRGKGSMFCDDKPTDEVVTRELADAKVQMLVKDGIIKELKDLILEKNSGKKTSQDEIVTQKWEEKFG